jgi:LPS export ABC transporter protein LptC
MALAVTLLFACESNFDQIQKMNMSEMMPTGNADSIHLKYSDLGIVKSVLKAPKMLDFSAVQFPFTEFPQGILLTLFDEQQKASFVSADYAISFKETGIIDLRDNVKLTSPEGQVLETSQLFYDQKNQWFFTEKNFTFTDVKIITKGEGIDFNKDFTRITYQNVYAESEVDQN